MGFTRKELKAIFAVAKKNNYSLRLCQKPWVYFTTAEKHPIAMRIGDILEIYESDQKEERRNKQWANSPRTALNR
jgi:hypothetical protein